MRIHVGTGLLKLLASFSGVRLEGAELIVHYPQCVNEYYWPFPCYAHCLSIISNAPVCPVCTKGPSVNIDVFLETIFVRMGGGGLTLFVVFGEKISIFTYAIFRYAPCTCLSQLVQHAACRHLNLVTCTTTSTAARIMYLPVHANRSYKKYRSTA